MAWPASGVSRLWSVGFGDEIDPLVPGAGTGMETLEDASRSGGGASQPSEPLVSWRVGSRTRLRSG